MRRSFEYRTRKKLAVQLVIYTIRQLRLHLQKKATHWNVSVRPCYLSDFDWLCFVFVFFFSERMQDEREGDSQRRASELQRLLRDSQQREENSHRQLREMAQRGRNLARQLRELQEREQTCQRQLTESQQREENFQRQLTELQQRKGNSQR